jgi:hypothetical protein
MYLSGLFAVLALHMCDPVDREKHRIARQTARKGSWLMSYRLMTGQIAAKPPKNTGVLKRPLGK